MLLGYNNCFKDLRTTVHEPPSLYPRHLSSFSYSLKFRMPSLSRSNSW